jgi:tetratricopeptide (TPR) repeat protein
MPPATGNSLTDKTIALWMGRVKTEANNDGAWVSLGDALMQKARETMDASYYRHAEQVYQKALALNTKNVDATLGMAWVAGGRHDFEQSVEWANKVLALDPRSNIAYGLLGDAAVEKGDYDKALDHYQTMLDIRPDLSSYSRGAHLLFLMGDMRKAFFLMNKAIKAGAPYAENTAWCRAQLARMYMSTGYLLPAEQMLKSALKQAPNNYHLLAAMGSVYMARKNYKAAIEQYKKAVAVAPQIELLTALGDLYALTGNKEEAQKQFDLVEATHKLNKANGVSGEMQMARFFADHDRNLPESLKMAEAGAKTRPNVHTADTLAWCYYKNGRYTEAKEAIQKALRLKTPDPTFHFHAGMIYAKLGERTAAQKHLYQAVNLNPNFHPVYGREAVETMQQLAALPIQRAVGTR